MVTAVPMVTMVTNGQVKNGDQEIAYFILVQKSQNHGDYNEI